MKILFIVKTIDFIDPQGIMQLSAIAKENNCETFLGIMDKENILEEKISDINPKIICYSASTGEHKYYLKINKLIKEKFPNILTIMGGPHPTFYPECIEKSELDAICVGEGDETLVDVIKAIEKGNSIKDIENIYTKEKKNNLRQLYADLDKLPFPDRDLFYKTTEMGNFPIKSFMASRGCPYSCTYCFNYAFRELYKGKGKPIRRKSVNRIIEEIIVVKNRYKIQFIKFYDDIFAYPDDEWLVEFCKIYKKEIKLPFHCATRCNLVNEDMVKLLKDTGCVSINMSIEAANPHLRNQILKRNISNEEIERSFYLFYKYNIKTFSNNIIGLPFSKIEDDTATVDMNIKCKVTFAEFPILHPYPGTELGKYCIEKGIFKEDYDSLHMSYQHRSPLSCFTEKEKNIQENISQLGLIALFVPSLRNIIMKYLIKLPNNFIFFMLYLLTKIYLIKIKIYPFKLELRDFWGLLKKSISIDKFKHTEEKVVK